MFIVVTLNDTVKGEKMADCQITCVTLSENGKKLEHIVKAGNPPTWIWPRENIVQSIEAGTNTFFVIDPSNGKRANVRVVVMNGKKYIRTSPDNDINDNLLSLKTCPTT